MGNVGGAVGDEGWVAMVMSGACWVGSHVRLRARKRRDGWREGRSAVLPVAVGHGIVILFLLKELSDGQQLFQHVLQREKTNETEPWFTIMTTWHVSGTDCHIKRGNQQL